uniref:DUF5683 domain-containing protein n=1 Tax=Ascaris lumbricoides TaxID=6252 RepID=A0A0M3I4B7_ASCLU
METLKLQQERRNTSLERAYEDAAKYVRELGAASKRMGGVMHTEGQRWALFYWKARYAYISELIATSTAEFNGQLFEPKQILMTTPSSDGTQRPYSTTRYGNEFFEAQSRGTSAGTCAEWFLWVFVGLQWNKTTKCIFGHVFTSSFCFATTGAEIIRGARLLMVENGAWAHFVGGRNGLEASNNSKANVRSGPYGYGK